jgi:iron complex outermembrane receptor protein
VTVGGNNEIVSPLVRGLSDILTTLDGREIFTAEGRGFAFQDLPAEAIARVDVFKSNTANLIEGGVAGTIDLRLNKAFNYTKPTVALSGKLNYPSNAEKVGPQVSFLATDRWDTGVGEIGALINVSWYDMPYNRPSNYVADRRSGNVGPAGATGLLLPISTVVSTNMAATSGRRRTVRCNGRRRQTSKCTSMGSIRHIEASFRQHSTSIGSAPRRA